MITFTAIRENPISFIAGGSVISFTVNTGSVNIVNTLIEEELAGIIDGVNKIFTTTKNFRSGSAKVFINGIKQRPGESFTETANNEITFSEAPSIIGFPDYLIINFIEE
jgi:hypothetical protein